MSLLSAITVEPVLFFYMLSVFMQYSVFQDLIYQKVCARSYNETVCLHLYDPININSLDFVQNHSSYWILASTIALTIPSIFVSTFLGSWCDLFGRKLPLLIPSVGGILSSVVYICVSMSSTAPLELILLACTLSGIFGGFISCIMATMSYVSDSSTTERRTSRVMVLESMTFLGGTLGPLIGSVMLPATNHAAVFGLILACHCVVIIYVTLALPQVRSSGGSGEVGPRHRVLSCWHVAQVFGVVCKPREGGQRANIVTYLLACVVIMVVTSGEMDISYLYLKDAPLEWDYSKYSNYIALRYGLGATMLLLLGPLLLRSGLVGDKTLCLAGLISRAAGLLLLGFASTDLLVWLVPVVSAGSYLSVPALRSLLSKQVEPRELGKVFACLAMLEGSCLLLGSLIFNSLYPAVRELHLPGLTFHVAAILLVLPSVLVCLSARRERQLSVHSRLIEEEEPVVN